MITKQEKLWTLYAAFANHRGGWTVKRSNNHGRDWHVMEVRDFDTFEEADRCANEIAQGAHGYVKGGYICMR